MVKIGILGLNDAYNNEDWYINNFSFKISIGGVGFGL
jgi:hypothetical protein